MRKKKKKKDLLKNGGDSRFIDRRVGGWYHRGRRIHRRHRCTVSVSAGLLVTRNRHFFCFSTLTSKKQMWRCYGNFQKKETPELPKTTIDNFQDNMLHNACPKFSKVHAPLIIPIKLVCKIKNKYFIITNNNKIRSIIVNTIKLQKKKFPQKLEKNKIEKKKWSQKLVVPHESRAIVAFGERRACCCIRQKR